MSESLEAIDFARATALPKFGDGHIPPERDRSVADDDTRFGAVVTLLLRAWPYLKPQVFGRWYVPGEGVRVHRAETVGGRGYGLSYAPVLVTVLALLWPVLGRVPEVPMMSPASVQIGADGQDSARAATRSSCDTL